MEAVRYRQVSARSRGVACFSDAYLPRSGRDTTNRRPSWYHKPANNIGATLSGLGVYHRSPFARRRVCNRNAHAPQDTRLLLGVPVARSLFLFGRIYFMELRELPVLADDLPAYHELKK